MPIFNLAGIIFKSATCPLWAKFNMDRGEFCEAGFSADVTTKRDCETVQTPNDGGELSNSVAVKNMMPDMMKPFMTQSLKISVILHSFVRAPLWCMDIMRFRISRVTSARVCLLPIGINRAAPTAAFERWTTSLFVGLQAWAGEAEGYNGKIFIREYSPEAMNIVGVPTAHQC